MTKKILIIILLFLSFFSFYKINENNYEKYNEIKKNLVDHPENLPKKEVAKATSF
jgi:Zn-dependent membrane protease YugP